MIKIFYFIFYLRIPKARADGDDLTLVDLFDSSVGEDNVPDLPCGIGRIDLPHKNSVAEGSDLLDDPRDRCSTVTVPNSLQRHFFY